MSLQTSDLIFWLTRCTAVIAVGTCIGLAGYGQMERLPSEILLENVKRHDLIVSLKQSNSQLDNIAYNRDRTSN